MARIKAAGGERVRRKWSVGEKVRVVRELERTGAAMSEIGRRYGAHVSMVKRWRAQYRAGEFGSVGGGGATARLVPVRVVRNGPRAARRPGAWASTVSADGVIEVQLAGGPQVRIRGVVDAGMLRTVLEQVARS